MLQKTFFYVNLYKNKKMKKVIQIPHAPKPIGPYSQAILIENTLYISGQIPINPKTGDLVNNTIQESTHQVMKNILALLKEANMKINNIVKCSIFLKNMETFSEVNKVYSEYFKELPPARETIEVSKLPLDVDIEISCVAILH